MDCNSSNADADTESCLSNHFDFNCPKLSFSLGTIISCDWLGQIVGDLNKSSEDYGYDLDKTKEIKDDAGDKMEDVFKCISDYLGFSNTDQVMGIQFLNPLEYISI